jgi:hypothetical protein
VLFVGVEITETGEKITHIIKIVHPEWYSHIMKEEGQKLVLKLL